MIDTTLKRRRSFSLRMLFVVVTLFGVTLFGIWLGWNLHWVHRRQAMRKMIISRNGAFATHAQLESKFPGASNADSRFRQVSAIGRLLGAEPVAGIYVFERDFNGDEFAEIRRLFPEAIVNYR